MEGISHEAASFAGHNQLDKLIVLYDSNDISLDGELNKAFSENVKERFEAYGWEHIFVKDGNDLETIDKAIEDAKSSNKPTIIEVKTIIGYGAPNKQGKASAHGEPLGEEELKAAKQTLGWRETEAFAVPVDVAEYMKTLQAEFAKKEHTTRDKNTLKITRLGIPFWQKHTTRLAIPFR